MCTNSLEISKEIEKHFQALCNNENKRLGNYVAQKLNFQFSDVSAELPGFTSLVKQQCSLYGKSKELNNIIQETSNILKQTIDYIIEEYKNHLTKLYNLVKLGIKDRDEGLKLYWINIAPKIEEQQLLADKKFANPLNKIEPTIQMIQNLIEPMLRLDSFLLINAYMAKNHINDNKKKKELFFLLNNVYSELFPTQYQSIIYSETKAINSLDAIRILRNAFKHGNYKLDNNLCIITEKGMKGQKLTSSELYHIFFNIFNIRIFCRTVSGYIFDIFTAKYPELRNVTNIHINTVTTDLNVYLLNYGIQIELSDDYFCENLDIDNKSIQPNAGGKKLFFKFKILLSNSINKSLDLVPYIIGIIKCYESIFPYQMIEKNDVMCAILLIYNSCNQIYLFGSFDEIEQLEKSRPLSIAKSIAFHTKINQ
ncbi:hypothetical protein [Clostridium sp. CTA-6]|nr:hypothetical protein [Clostridium botulinum]